VDKRLIVPLAAAGLIVVGLALFSPAAVQAQCLPGEAREAALNAREAALNSREAALGGGT